ncbi:MAG: hypothetical protein ACR2LY_08955 [Thermoleophilaceae bacterium]
MRTLLLAALGISLAGCGQPGGTASELPAPVAVDTTRCLRAQNYDARADLAGANLIEAELAIGAVIVSFRQGNVANIFFFERDVEAERANSEAQGDVESFRDNRAVTAYAEDPSREERERIKDCLPSGNGADRSAPDEEEDARR